MTEKRFTLGVCENGLGLIDNQTHNDYFETDDTTLIRLCEVLNELNDENTHIKQTIREAYKTERTQIGKNTLKQLIQSLE